MANVLRLTKRYLYLSNQHDLPAVFAMFAQTATYSSVGVGSHAGRVAIESMMSKFFAERRDIRWECADTSFVVQDRSVSFDFLATHTDAATGAVVRRTGHETLRFNEADEIEHVQVERIVVLDSD